MCVVGLQSLKEQAIVSDLKNIPAQTIGRVGSGRSGLIMKSNLFQNSDLIFLQKNRIFSPITIIKYL